MFPPLSDSPQASRRIRSKVNATTYFHILLAASICLLLIDCQEKPDYSKNSEFGSLPNGVTKGQRGMEYSSYSSIPSPLACNHPYKFTVGTKQQVAGCDKFNFTELYNRAAADRDARIKKLDCPKDPKDCVLYSRDTLRKGNCDELGNGIILAYVTIQTEVSCLKSTDEKPEGLKAPTADSLKSPFQEPPGGAPLPFQEADELIFEEVGDSVDAACPSSDLVTVEYTEKVKTCEKIDFQPYVKGAEDRAAFSYDLLKCQDNKRKCEKEPFKVLKTAWECAVTGSAPGSDVVVQVKAYFQLICKQKP